MGWDIAIVAGIALSQLFVTIYAVWVSVTESKIKTAGVIALVGTVGIALTVLGLDQLRYTHFPRGFRGRDE